MVIARQAEEVRVHANFAAHNDPLGKQVVHVEEVGRAIFGIVNECRDLSPFPRHDGTCGETGVRQRKEEGRVGNESLIDELRGAIAARENVLIGGTEHVFLAREYDEFLGKRLRDNEVRDVRYTRVKRPRWQEGRKHRGSQSPGRQAHVAKLAVPMFGPHEQRSMRQAAEFLQIEYQVVFAAAGVFERIALPQRYRQHGRKRRIDAPVDAEPELSHASGKGDPGLLQARTVTQPVACHRGTRPETTGLARFTAYTRRRNRHQCRSLVLRALHPKRIGLALMPATAVNAAINEAAEQAVIQLVHRSTPFAGIDSILRSSAHRTAGRQTNCLRRQNWLSL